MSTEALTKAQELRVVDPPRRQRDWTGLRVRATRDLENMLVTIPAGRLGCVDYSSGVRIHVVFDACECCGVNPHWSFKPGNYVRSLPIEFVAEPVAALATKENSNAE